MSSQTTDTIASDSRPFRRSRSRSRQPIPPNSTNLSGSASSRHIPNESHPRLRSVSLEDDPLHSLKQQKQHYHNEKQQHYNHVMPQAPRYPLNSSPSISNRRHARGRSSTSPTAPSISSRCRRRKQASSSPSSSSSSSRLRSHSREAGVSLVADAKIKFRNRSPSPSKASVASTIPATQPNSASTQLVRKRYYRPELEERPRASSISSLSDDNSTTDAKVQFQQQLEKPGPSQAVESQT
ncbi:unnamed protein product [Protopolystoma xenopodis]|uniref:Uncharacterized protein n=1 Tax=Protopolystoma xenopodis TaxID=117903 RepID=A0A448WLN6_9PLAT|nr:unnamed protein product [Protopolystoma xenopodis]